MLLSWRDGAWLAVVLLLHGSLLLIPFKVQPAIQDQPRILTLSLLAQPAPKTVRAPARNPVEPVENTIPDTSAEHQSEIVPPVLPQPSLVVTEPVNPPEQTTTARLVDSASRHKWSVSTPAEQRQLGVHELKKEPENWRPSISLEDNLFNGMTKPAETEIVDAWLSSDGSHNVVINTPSGETLCGRQQAWDPMNPMIENLMMFKTCGGGGKRTFKMPDRFTKHLVD